MHEIKIPSFIKERVLKRRGTLKIFESLNTKSCALLVIDMQNCFVLPGLSLVEVPGVGQLAPKINLLAKVLRNAGGKVVWTKHQYTSDWVSWHDHFCDVESRNSIIKDTQEGAFPGEIWEGMEVDKNDSVVTKKRSSALAPDSNELRSLLIAQNIDTLIVTGTLSNVCCESTTRDAMFLNYKTIFVSDANGTRSDEEHNSTLINMIQFFADVRTTEDVISLIKKETLITK